MHRETLLSWSPLHLCPCLGWFLVAAGRSLRIVLLESINNFSDNSEG